MPLTTRRVIGTATPFRVNAVRAPAAAFAGTMPVRPLDPGACATSNRRLPAADETLANDELLRPSSQVSIWPAETTGTPRATAASTIACAPGCGEESVCMFAVNAP